MEGMLYALKIAEEQGVELVYVPIGLEGFVFFVNEKWIFNPKMNDKKCYIQLNELYKETAYDRNAYKNNC